MVGTQLALDKIPFKISNAASVVEDRLTSDPMEEGSWYWLRQYIAALTQANLPKIRLEVDDLTVPSTFFIDHIPTHGIMATQMDMVFGLVHEGAALEEHVLKVETVPSADTGVVLFRPTPVVQTTRERLWAMGEEGRSRALEYYGDPIEDLHRILPEDLSAEEWQSIISGAYD